MAGNNASVLAFDIVDDGKIQRLEELAYKLKAALSIGPGGFPVTMPGVLPGNPIDNEANQLPTQNSRDHSAPENRKPEDQPVANQNRLRDDKGRFLATGNKKGGGSGGAVNPFADADKFLKEMAKIAKGTSKAFGQANKTLDMTRRQLKSIFRSAVKWGAWVTLLAGGGTLGYDMFARHVAQQYSGSQGLNMTTGQMMAANNVYGPRFSGVENVLHGLAGVQNDTTSPLAAGLQSLGIKTGDGAAKNLPKLFQAVYDLTKDLKNSSLAYSVIKSRHLDGLISPELLNQILANGKNLAGLGQKFVSTSQALNISPAVQGSYQELTTTFLNNVDEISNTFKTKLATLNGPIGDLSTALTKAVDAFINGPNGTAVFDMIRDGLTDLSNWISSPKFKEDLDDFSTKVGEIVKAIGRGIDDIYMLISDPKKGMENLGSGTGKDGATPELVNFGNKYLGGKLPGANPLTNKYTDIYSEDIVYKNYQMPDGLKDNIQNFVNVANDTYQLPKGLMSAVAGKESSWNPLALNKDSGAAGLFQFISGTAKAYGLSDVDRFDPNKETYAAAKYFKDLSKRYHGDIAEMLTSYNGGVVTKDGNLSLKKETVDYLRSILPQVQGAEAQHPQLMEQLRKAAQYLSTHKGERVHIELGLAQTPGSDVGLTVKSQGVRLPVNVPMFVIPG